jgi:hypothetical protein
MVPWVFLILLLDIVLITQVLYCADCTNQVPMIILGVGIAISAGAILIRTLRKMKMGRIEQMGRDLESLRSENKELLARIASIREREIMQRTDDNLV